ncbi:beta-N-acetylhexosaminidase [candidate division KSB1 bacterium]|nr:family 20 glycosylhydrolase [candidate division KSB1 bacterium]RQW00364.1 MAG: beta-N-acetylhexosaminidase [candidate division KSB1 bacterium]
MNIRFSSKAAIVTGLVLSSCTNKYAVRGDASNRAVSIIPQPTMLELQTGELRLSNDLKIVADTSDHQVLQVVDFIAEALRRSTGYDIPVVEKSAHDDLVLVLTIIDSDDALGSEGYELEVNKAGIHLSAETPAGLFYGIQTVLQNLPPDVYAAKIRQVQWKMPCLKIRDVPRYAYRGMHLDVCRHFFPVDFIKKYIDLIALHKMNVFHWHLTDDQGWRIEIKKYPKLTQVSAFRDETVIGHGRNRPQQFDGERYGGFYSQDEIREIVQYAQERFVTIIPEIEMPGHALAALAAYPELSCTGGPFKVGTTWGVYDDVYCAGNEQVYTFLQDVLTEVVELFPGSYVHIGGDECPKTRWKECDKCQARIRQEGLKDEHELQSYFIRRIESFLLSKGKRLIGWDEILEGGLAPQATVMSWRGIDGGIAAAKQDHDVIMTPNSHLYFDHYQANPDSEPLAIGGYTTQKKVYSYETTPSELMPDEQKYILGAQANIWTEYIKTPDHVEYMALPRMCALAEVVWTLKEQKNWQDFQQRLQTHLKRLDVLNVNVAKGSFDVTIYTEYETNDRVYVQLESEQYRPTIFYTTDGTEPNPKALRYKGRFPLKKTTTIKAAIFQDGVMKGPVTSKTITVHKALGKAITYQQPFSDRYPASGRNTLVDGLLGSHSFNDGNWQGFLGNDVEVIVDLGSVHKIRKISTGFFQSANSWIFLPQRVDYAVSLDGQNYQQVASIANDISASEGGSIIHRFAESFAAVEARYVRVFADNRGTCPERHPGAGEKAWVFADEIIVE